MDSLIKYNELQVPVYKNLNNGEMVGRSYLYIANLYLTGKQDLEKGGQNLLEAEKYLHKTENYEKRALLNYLMAQVNAFQRKPETALKYYNENLNYYNQNKIQDKLIILNTYQGIFSNNYIQNDLANSFTALNNYIEFTQKHFPEYLYAAYRSAGAFYLSSLDYPKSLNAFKKAQQIAQKNSSESEMADINVFIGTVYAKLEQYDTAEKHLKEAEAYFVSKKSPKNLKLVNYAYYSIYQAKKDYKKAQDAMEKVLKDTKVGDDYYKEYHLAMANVQMKQLLQDSAALKTNNQKQEQLKSLINETLTGLKSLEMPNTWTHPENFIQGYKVLHEAYSSLGDYKNSYEYLKKYADKKEATYGAENLRQLSSTEADYELREQKAKIEFEEQAKRLQLQKDIELKALKFEYEKKQAAVKTEEERKRLLLEEDLKRREIEMNYAQQKKEADAKFQQEQNLAKIEKEKAAAIAKAEIESSKSEKNMWAIGAGLSLLLLIFAVFSYFQKRKDNKKIAEEKQKSENLLLNILPQEVAEELKENGKTNAKHFDEVSVLFTDFVNFTANSERIGVQEVLNELNVCFTEFDSIMEKYGLEKIKTIGDAYLAVSGLPASNQQHAQNAVHAGLEILKFIEKRKGQNPNALDIRIGIHSGSVIAGIVGVKKFAYDIWGDTVNTAARMEQNSEKGKINISEATFELVKEKVKCEHRGKIDTKGKGAMDMYFVNI